MGETPSVGEKIRALRKKLKMTQQELAGNEFTKSFISQIEKNHARPSLRSLQIIADRLGKPVSYFLQENFTDAPATPDKLEHLILLAARLEQEDKFDDAINYYEEALTLLDKTNYQQRGQLYFYLGRAHHRLGQMHRSAQMFELAVVELELAHDWELLAYTHNSLGDLRLQQGDANTAVTHFEKALDAIERNVKHLPSLHTMTLTNLGIACGRAGQYAKAEDHLLTALEESTATKTYYKYGDICMTLGYIYYHRGNLDRAYEYTTRAWHFYTAIEDNNMQVQCQINLGAIERTRGNFQTAEKQLLEAIKLSEASNNAFNHAHAYEELAEVYLARQPSHPDDTAKAEAALQKALTYYSDPLRLARTRQLLAEVYARQQRIDEAIQTLQDVVEILQPKQADTRLAEVYSRLGELYEARGDTAKAAKFMRESINIFKKLQQSGIKNS